MAEFSNIGDSERSYDCAIYVLRCEYEDTRPEIDRKFLAPRSKPESRELIGRIPRRNLIPDKGDRHTGVDHWIVTDEDGSVQYPLYQELASEAGNVYYVGQGSRLETRVRQQTQPSRTTQFLENAEITGLADVRVFSIDMDGPALIEGLEAEMGIELRQGSGKEEDIRADYRAVIDKIRAVDNVTIHDVNSWRRYTRQTMDRFSFTALGSYRGQVSDLRSRKERDIASEYVEVCGERLEGGFRPVNLRSYAFWK